MMFTCPSVKRKIGNQEIELRMDFNAVSLAETFTGRNLLDQQVWDNMSVSTVTALFWACASQCNPKLTLGDVRNAGYKEAQQMIEALREAWRVSNDAPPEDPRPTSGSKEKESAVSAT